MHLVMLNLLVIMFMKLFLNKKIMLNDYEYTIGGVFDCDCDGYGTIINNQEEGDYQLAEQLDFEQDQYLSKIIVKRGFKKPP